MNEEDQNKTKKYYSAGDVCKKFNICYKTLYRWAKDGKIEFIHTNNGRKRYLIDSETDRNNKKTLLYARVSSRKQEHELSNQIKFLTGKYPNGEIVKDIGSAFNFNRRGFNYVISEVFKHNVECVYVAHPDRISRLSFELFQNIFKHFGTKLIAISRSTKNDNKYEFAEDVIGIITYYTAKYYGRRKYNIGTDSST